MHTIEFKHLPKTVNKKISVLLPVYNGDKYVAEAIDSILVQTYRNIELIIINDGSTDQTLNILKEYEKKDPRILVVSRENRGLISTLNEGIELASGEWIARMDADDIAVSTRFEKQLQWADKVEADIVGSWVKFFGSIDRRVWRGSVTDDAIKVDMLFKCPLVHPSVMVRTAVIRQLKYDLQADKAEDYDLWIRAAKTGAVFANVPEVLLYYRKHATQVTVLFRAEQLKRTEDLRREYWGHVTQRLSLENSVTLSCESFNTSVPYNEIINSSSMAVFCKNLVIELNSEAKQTLWRGIYKLSLYKPGLDKVLMELGGACGVSMSICNRLAIKMASLLPPSLRFGFYVKVVNFLT